MAAQPPPAILAVNPVGIPAELAGLPQFVFWTLELKPSKKGLSWTKVPRDPRTGARSLRSVGARAAALAGMRQFGGDGVGFVFSRDDPYFGIDLDDCRDPETGVIAPWALGIVEYFRTYTEVSPTGRGLHLIGRGVLPGRNRNTKPVEVYGHSHYFTMTGCPLPGYEEIRDCSAFLAEWYWERFAETPVTRTAPARSGGTQPASMGDADLLRRCRRSEKFRRLNAGDDRDYGDDTSGGDLAFCNDVRLMGGNRAQIDRLFRSSSRTRDKWDERHDGDGRSYGEMTLDRCFTDAKARVSSARGSQATAGRTGAEEATLEDLPQDVPTLHAMIHKLETANRELQTGKDHLKAELDEARRTISGMVQMGLNPHLPVSAKMALTSVLLCAEHRRQRGEIRPDGSIEVTSVEISGDYRPEPAAGVPKQSTNADGSKPRMARQDVGKTMEMIVTRGILQARPRKVSRTRRNGALYQDTVWDVRVPVQNSDVLALAAAWKPDRPKPQREPKPVDTCPDCGERHPVVRSVHCGGCGANRSRRDVHAVDPAVAKADPVILETGDAHKKKGHLSSVVNPYVHRKKGHGLERDGFAVPPAGGFVVPPFEPGWHEERL